MRIEIRKLNEKWAVYLQTAISEFCISDNFHDQIKCFRFAVRYRGKTKIPLVVL